MRSVLYIAAACLLLQACGNTEENKTSKLESISWINGFWKMTTPQGTTTESWNKDSDSSYTGVGKYIDSNGQVLSTEEIRIVLRKDMLWYIPTVSDQNMGQAISFRELSFSDSVVVFENKEHDFPQRIGYTMHADGSMTAYIEGTIEGETQHIEYAYSKQ